uniref:Uncharacterized protein n=1 Tax=Strigamia maritima TaxID=126957 RepID=T1IUQ6_STRMM
MATKSSKMSSKNKHEKAVVSEVTSARSKLDGMLQTLVTRAEDNDLIDPDNIKLEQDVLNDFLSLSPKKGSPGKPPRKRRRKDDPGASETNSFHHTYVMKLFDRSVDLAQFNDEVPLYPVCRSWMQNQPQRINLKPSSPVPDIELVGMVELSEDGKEDPKSKIIRQLPNPTPKPDSIDLRKPSPIPPSSTEPFKFPDEFEPLPNREILMDKHLTRWKSIRQKWKEAAMKNEKRYKDSLTLIKSIFER